ncbi:acyl-CoA dehydrogenase family protein [Nocardia vaccinii]|uniref:acyl-CoA dehydrogenase family protein n=1 Tax=Nocardia vaccinii TaxID=1822 RepID=UPI000832987B|nr:acyl-CoA dehydrogenase family protein [Nocardia vaccinii]
MDSDDQQDLRKSVQEFLRAYSSTTAVRALMDSVPGYDPAVWRRISTELGLPSIAIPEEFGGAGAGMAELAVVFEEMGAALLCAPYFSTVAFASHTVAASADRPAMAELLPGLADGSMTATVIINGHLGPWDPNSIDLRIRRHGGGYVVDGAAPMVLDGHTADLLLVAARGDAGISLAAVRSGTSGVRHRPLARLDRTRSISAIDFDCAAATLIGDEGHAEPALRTATDLATVALCAEQVGGAQRCLDAAVSYASTRIQFGRPIGSFQAVKHRCADMLVRLEGARSALRYAVATADSADRDELRIASSVAKLAASEAFLHCAIDNMRTHGGIGFTWEHDAHLYFRRAKAGQLMLGSPDWHAERLARLIGDC